MDRNLAIGLQWVVLAAAIGTYAAVVGVTLILPLAAVVALPAIWYVARGAEGLREHTVSNGLIPEDYSAVYYGGLTAASLGFMGYAQATEGMMYPGLSGVAIILGALFIAGGVYEDVKRGVASWN
jgi:hypothetical protein